MRITQRKFGFGVIKAHIKPGLGAMALGTVGPECRRVRILFLVTGDATRHHLTILLTFFMARKTIQRTMLADQWKIGVLMVKNILIQFDNICLSSFVFGVT